MKIIKYIYVYVYKHTDIFGAGASHVMLVVKNLPVNSGDIKDAGLIPGLGRSPREGHGNPLQYSCLENPRDSENCWATG